MSLIKIYYLMLLIVLLQCRALQISAGYFSTDRVIDTKWGEILEATQTCSFLFNASYFHLVRHPPLYAEDYFFANGDRHDAVIYNHDCIQLIGIIEGVVSSMKRVANCTLNYILMRNYQYPLAVITLRSLFFRQPALFLHILLNLACVLQFN